MPKGKSRQTPFGENTTYHHLDHMYIPRNSIIIFSIICVISSVVFILFISIILVNIILISAIFIIFSSITLITIFTIIFIVILISTALSVFLFLLSFVLVLFHAGFIWTS